MMQQNRLAWKVANLHRRSLGLIRRQLPQQQKQKQTQKHHRSNPLLSRHSHNDNQFSHTRSTDNGRDYVEEHREKVTGAHGETRIATRHRVGDRGYENVVLVDKDGKRTERETWHNVGDDDIEQSKLERVTNE
jgi:hypothetical protein